MTPLRQWMLKDMQLRGFSARTQEGYVVPPSTEREMQRRGAGGRGGQSPGQ